MPHDHRKIIPVAAVIIVTVVCGLVYATVQQNYRQGANDPQIQIAEDAARALEAGSAPESQIPSGQKIDVSKSLALFVVVYDDNGNPIASSAQFEGQIPKPPIGVFGFAKKYGEHRFTWQPRTDVRIATILVHYAGAQPGFVLAGRSLREVERREHRLRQTVALAWFASLITIAIGYYLYRG